MADQVSAPEHAKCCLGREAGLFAKTLAAAGFM